MRLTKDKAGLERPLLTPDEFIEYTGLDLQPSTLATARTSGSLGGMPAPKFTVVLNKPYYKICDVREWLDGLPTHASNAEHRAKQQ